MKGDELPADQLKPLLDQVAAATGYQVQIIPPTSSSGVQGSGKQVVSCTGLQINLTDTHTQSPVPACLPPIDPMVPAARLGFIRVKQSGIPSGTKLLTALTTNGKITPSEVERLVTQRKERPSQRSEDFKFVVGPLDRG